MNQLSERQKSAVAATKDRHCVVVAVAGAGKTTVLGQRVKLLVKAGYDRLLIITFTRKAAKSLAERIGEMPETVFIGTFHSFCYRVLKEFSPESLTSKFLSENQLFKVELLAAQEIRKRGIKLDTTEVYPHMCSLFKDGHSPEDWVTASDKKALATVCTVVYKRLKAEGFMFFEELALKTLQLLKECEHTRSALQERYPIIKVDEFQDTDLTQVEILKLLAAGESSHLYVVGDASQSIYTWRGCRPETIDNFDGIFGESTRIVLDTNYRSNDAILANANSILEAIGAETRMSGIKGTAKFPVSVHQYAGPDKEAEHVAEQILEAGDPQNYAILYRTNSQSGLVQNALAKRKIPFSVSGNVQSFFDMPETRMMVSYAKLLCDPTDVDSLKHIWNRPNRFLKNDWLLQAVSDTASHDAEHVVRQVMRQRKLRGMQKTAVKHLAELLHAFKMPGVSFPELAGKIYAAARKQGYFAKLAENSSSRDTSDIERAANQMLKIVSEHKHPKSLLDHIEFTKQLQKESQELGQGVTLSTIHSAKGLEFPKVFLIGVEDEVLPHKDMFSLEEEQRLLYVAVTRAEQRLVVSHYSKPSEFIKLLVAEKHSEETESV